MTDIEIVAIIGAGPAGMAAALQLKRYGLNPLLLERAEIGGLLRNANLVENYPGFPGGIPGPNLVRLFAEQIKGIGIAVTYAEVSKLSLEAETFVIKTNDGKKYLSKTVIIASGTQPRTFKDFAIPNLLRNRIYYEVYPLLAMRGKTIAIVGAGDAAFDYALNLARNNRVLILNRDSNVNCLPLLQQRADQNPHIHYQAGISISRVTEAPEGNLRLICNSSQQIMEIEADYLVGALGREPQLDFLGEEISGKIQQLEKQGNLFLIGDVKNGLYRQTAIAVGDAIKVAMQIYQQEVST